jgi:hypothetical protein
MTLGFNFYFDFWEFDKTIAFGNKCNCTNFTIPSTSKTINRESQCRNCNALISDIDAINL